MPRILSQADITRFRDRLCDVAAQLYAETGHDGFNMRALAQRVGVSAMTPYRYFRDKDEILDLLRGRAFARLAARLEAAACMAATGAGRHVAVGRAYLCFALEEETSYRLMFDLGRPGVRDRVRRESLQILALLSGEVAGESDTGWMLWSLLHGLIAMHFTRMGDEAELKDLMEAAIQKFMPVVGRPTSPIYTQTRSFDRPAAFST